MTQPPQQPGFGAPQQPQQPPAQPPLPPQPPVQPPGFGNPQPAYGYPAAPPQQPNPYAQQPPGYGYPGQPGPPGYGYPAPPTVPMSPQPGGPGGPGGGRKVNAQLLIIVSAVVAIALIIGAGVLYSKSDSGSDEAKKDDKSSASPADGGSTGGTGTSTGGTPTEKAPANTASKVLFQVPMPKVAKNQSIALDGSWITDKVYAKSGVAEVDGYDLDKGTKLWTVKLPGPVCHASRFLSADGTKTAVLFKPSMPTAGSSAPCTQVGALDLDAGKMLWTKTVSAGDSAVNLDNVTVSAGTVAVGGTSGGAAFDLASGKSLWQPKTTDSCYDAGYGGGPKLVAVRRCGGYDNQVLKVQTLDPASGKVISSYQMTSGIKYASVVSTDPLVVGADVGDSATDGSALTDLFSIDNGTGQLRARISVPSAQFGASCDILQIDGCTGVTAAGDKLYIITEDHDGSAAYSKTNEIVAFDVTTGKQTGQRADAGDGYDYFPLRMDGSNLIAYKRAPYDKGGEVVSIDGTTFKATVLMKNPDTQSTTEIESGLSPKYNEVLYAKGRLFMSGTYADSLAITDKRLVIAFGTTG